MTDPFLIPVWAAVGLSAPFSTAISFRTSGSAGYDDKQLLSADHDGSEGNYASPGRAS